MRSYTEVIKETGGLEQIDLFIGFTTIIEHLEQLTRAITPLLSEDTLFWICYPKKSSTNYKSEITRDHGWSVMAEFDLEPVGMIAIDQGWPELCLRNVHKIKKITRRKNMALTRAAKERTSNKK